jgi:hypothetical protein
LPFGFPSKLQQAAVPFWVRLMEVSGEGICGNFHDWHGMCL